MEQCGTGITVSLYSGYLPQANGQVERINKDLGRLLQIYCANHQTDWARFLPWAEYGQNSLHYSTTKLTPFQRVLGYQLQLFPWSPSPTEAPTVDEWFRTREQVWEDTH